MEDDGLRGAWLGTGGTDAVRFVLALEAVSARLGTRRSGVFELVMGGGADGGGVGRRPEPAEDTEANDKSDDMPSALIGDQSSDDLFDDVVDKACSFEPDLRIDCPKESVRGDFAEESVMEELDGDLASFFPNAPVKLHFFEGVLCTEEGGAVGVTGFCADKDWCFDGVLGKATGTSREA